MNGLKIFIVNFAWTSQTKCPLPSELRALFSTWARRAKGTMSETVKALFKVMDLILTQYYILTTFFQNFSIKKFSKLSFLVVRLLLSRAKGVGGGGGVGVEEKCSKICPKKASKKNLSPPPPPFFLPGGGGGRIGVEKK